MIKCSDTLRKKWGKILDHPDLPTISDIYRRDCTALVLENQERVLKEERQQGNYLLQETTTNTSAAANWDPVLISLVRRAMPNLIAYDIVGVQPMTGPTGLVFAMKSRYSSPTGTEALFNEADTDYSSGNSEHTGSSSQLQVVSRGAIAVNNSSGTGASDTTVVVDGDGADDTLEGDLLIIGERTIRLADRTDTTITLTEAIGVALADDTALTIVGTTTGGFGQAAETGGAAGAEHWGSGGTHSNIPEMSFSIEKSTVTARSRALKAEYTMELAHDLKAIHGLDAEAELANIISAEILAEINREVIRTVNRKAKLGAVQSDIATKGTFALNTDADGRWFEERYKGLAVQIEREANVIAKETRRGKGNFVICSSDVATALNSTNMMDGSAVVDDTGNTFVGTLNGRTKVFIDPYASGNYVTIGYRGESPFDAGMFYCPYVPLTMIRAVGENTFQPKIGFKTRYGMITNPFAETNDATQTGVGLDRSNTYFRIFGVNNIL